MQLKKLENRYKLPDDCDHSGRTFVTIDVDGLLTVLERISVSAWADIVRQDLTKQFGIPTVYAVYMGKMGEAIMMVHPRPNKDYDIVGHYTPMVKPL